MSGWEQSSTKRNLSCAVRKPGGVILFPDVRFLHIYPVLLSCLQVKVFQMENHTILNHENPITKSENKTGYPEAWNSLEACRICPRDCGANRLLGQPGYCGQTASIRIARAALHFWEEPCISGTSGSGTVFFSGCSLRCVFCQNHEIALGESGITITPERLIEIFFELKEKGANNINLVTPTHFIPQIATALAEAKEKGLSIPIVYNSGGYEEVNSLRMLEGLVDIYLPDCKYFSQETSKRYSNAPDYFEKVKLALEEMYRQVGDPVFDPATNLMKRGMIVRHLLLPGETKDTKKILRYLHTTYGNHIYISIMNQYTPLSSVSHIPELNSRVPATDYDKVLHFAEMIGIENGFMQEEGTAEESFIPPFDYEGVEKH